MSKIDTGGDAYPNEQGQHSNGSWNQTYFPGMTLLDYFAGQATEGDVQIYTPIMVLQEGALRLHDTGRKRTRVGAKYAYAAAMIAEKRRLEDLK